MPAQRGLALAHALSQIGPELMSWRLAQAADLGSLTWSPDVDVFERQDTLIVRMDLPGVSLSDVRIEIAQDELTISGERRYESHQPGDHWQSEERTYGRFFRRVALPDGAWSTRAATTLANGVLEITIPVVSYTS